MTRRSWHNAVVQLSIGISHASGDDVDLMQTWGVFDFEYGLLPSKVRSKDTWWASYSHPRLWHRWNSGNEAKTSLSLHFQWILLIIIYKRTLNVQKNNTCMVHSSNCHTLLFKCYYSLYWIVCLLYIKTKYY